MNQLSFTEGTAEDYFLYIEEIKNRPVIWNKQYDGHKDKVYVTKQFELILLLMQGLLKTQQSIFLKNSFLI